METKEPVASPKKTSSKKTKRNLKPGVIRFGREKRKIIRAITKKPNRKKFRYVAAKKLPKATVEKKADEKKTDEKNADGKKKQTKMPAHLKSANYYPVVVKKKKVFAKKKPTKAPLRKSLTAGTICIIVTGPYKGRRVVFLKQLESGLCLITGPFLFNRTPLRRINQIYLIATKTKIEGLESFEVPSHLNDLYFRRTRTKTKVKKDGETFPKKQKKFVMNTARVQDQKDVDNVVLKALKKNAEKKLLRCYLSSKFALSNKQYPHQLNF